MGVAYLKDPRHRRGTVQSGGDRSVLRRRARGNDRVERDGSTCAMGHRADRRITHRAFPNHSLRKVNADLAGSPVTQVICPHMPIVVRIVCVTLLKPGRTRRRPGGPTGCRRIIAESGQRTGCANFQPHGEPGTQRPMGVSHRPYARPGPWGESAQLRASRGTR